MPPLPWLKILKIAGPILVVLFVGWMIFSFGSNHGQNIVQSRWDKQKAIDSAFVDSEKKKISANEAVHRANDRKVSDELAGLKEANAAAIARIHGESALRLRDSSERASLYTAKAEAGATERANLASYAAQLDRSLAEGIGLVEEFRSTLELRDGQIKQLAAQIENDRQLISGSGTVDGNDTASAK